MCLYPNGNECYCGKKGSPPQVEIWHNYLRDLAITIDNIRMVISSDIIIGGILQPFITDEDLQLLNDYVKMHTTFKMVDFSLIRGVCGAKAAMIGSALTHINIFCKIYKIKGELSSSPFS